MNTTALSQIQRQSIQEINDRFWHIPAVQTIGKLDKTVHDLSDQVWNFTGYKPVAGACRQTHLASY